MANVTIKGISEDTLILLRKRAISHGRSMNKEIIDLLEQQVKKQSMDLKQLLKEIDKSKSIFKRGLHSKEIRNVIRVGRK